MITLEWENLVKGIISVLRSRSWDFCQQPETNLLVG